MTARSLNPACFNALASYALISIVRLRALYGRYVGYVKYDIRKFQYRVFQTGLLFSWYEGLLALRLQY